MKKLPCENCITLSICRAEAYEIYKTGYMTPEFILIGKLALKCDLISNHCKRRKTTFNNHYDYDSTKVIETAKYLAPNINIKEYHSRERWLMWAKWKENKSRA